MSDAGQPKTTDLDYSTQYIDELDAIYPGLWDSVKLYASLSPQPQAKAVDGEIDKYGRKFTYYHGTNAPLGQILQEGLKPGNDGAIYLSLREDFAANYGKTMVKVRLPYELERNPFSQTTNGEVRTATPIKPENISVTLTATDLSAHLQAAVREALIEELQQIWNRETPGIIMKGWEPDTPTAKYVAKRLKQLQQSGKEV